MCHMVDINMTHILTLMLKKSSQHDPIDVNMQSETSLERCLRVTYTSCKVC